MADGMTFPFVLGVFSRRLVMDIGSGTTMVDHKNVTYWYARQLGDEVFECQPMAVGGLPSGMTNKCSKGEFIRKHTPEPSYYIDHPLPSLESLAAKVLEDTEGMALASLDSDELDVLKALMVDPLEMPDSSSPGYERRYGEVLEAVQRLVCTLLSRGHNARYEHCTRLSGFGIALRKNGALDESISYFSKALDLTRDDENLHFNLARVFYDKGDIARCRESLEEALRINPVFTEAGKFVSYIKRKGPQE